MFKLKQMEMEAETVRKREQMEMIGRMREVEGLQVTEQVSFDTVVGLF